MWHDTKPPSGRGWAYKIETLDEFERKGLIEWSSDGVPRLKRYLSEVEGAAIQDVWDDIRDVASPEFLQDFFDYLETASDSGGVDVWRDMGPVLDRSIDHSGYPTQKPSELAERMISACCKRGGLVLDCFSGSGSTLVAAQQLGRRWIGCDINKGAIQTTAKRVQAVIGEQLEVKKSRRKQLALMEMDSEEKEIEPAQFNFTTWRVNDYDLQIQHNEAVNLACEHIGIERMRADVFFDGTLGKNLVKIIPFGHPLTPLDLEELRRELEARPEEDRNITLVCLGMELAANAWIEDWNRMRKGKNAVNKIEVIELRTDPKYGKFIEHKPATARVEIKRQKDLLRVSIVDFISPTIIERLTQQAGILRPQIDDWRAVVDCVMIDTTYDGNVFNVVLADIPEKKSDLVKGDYELPTAKEGAVVAVKIIDMLGEEVLIARPA